MVDIWRGGAIGIEEVVSSGGVEVVRTLEVVSRGEEVVSGVVEVVFIEEVVSGGTEWVSEVC